MLHSKASATDNSIDEICQALNYSRTYISTLFKRHRKTTIISYYNMLKIKEAKKLLRQKKHSVFEVSEMLGFENQYYFSRVFKKYEGHAPSEYRAQMR